MRRRRLPLGILLPGGLVVLLASLAVLQYRWLGQVSEAEREALSRSLAQRAHEFAEDFDREISRVYFAFQLGEEPIEVDRPDVLEKRFASWRAVARYPELVRHVYLVTHEGGQPLLRRYNADRPAFESLAWPATLEPVRRRLAPDLDSIAGEAAGARPVVTISTSALIREVPAIVVPLAGHEPVSPTPGAGGTIRMAEARPLDMLVQLRVRHDTLVIELDGDHLKNVVLPDVAERYFGGGTAAQYRIAIVDGNGTSLLTRGLEPNVSLTESQADIATRFFGLRLELTRTTLAGEPPVMSWQTTTTARRGGGGRGGAAPQAATRSANSISILLDRATAARSEFVARVGSAGWLLLVQHAAGSLDAAVAEARARNLWLSFGILSVLAASVGLIVLNARRSERLAGQQMDFVATVSHELRTPLAVIRSAAQNLSAGVVHDAGQARRYGDLIETEGRRLTDMVEQVLEFAGLSGNRGLARARPVDPGDVVRDAMASTGPLCDEQGVALTVTMAPDLPLVDADEDALRRAIGNLVTNALKYGADGRWIGVTAERATHRGSAEVRITVADRGRGIDPEDLPHIFEPFYRGRYAVERQIHGNGLGLSLVRRIAEAHGGRVSVSSAIGEGTSFTLHLPAVEPDRSVQPLGEPAAGAAPHA
ncbi:MAG TPA: HAMP domain-containing sensor histidine kinase [Vicinamibacterales bacterium]|nr:HAMP domain-containing sensor histidine kinase [Vicinamibacterales bacterium]